MAGERVTTEELFWGIAFAIIAVALLTCGIAVGVIIGERLL